MSFTRSHWRACWFKECVFGMRGVLHRLITLEGFSAWNLTWWGFWVWNFRAFSTTPSFAAMAEHAGEWAWGGGAMLIGLLQLTCLLLNWRRGRIAGAFLALLAWGVLASMFVLANPRTTGVPNYTNIAIFMFLVAIRDRLSDEDAV